MLTLVAPDIEHICKKTGLRKKYAKAAVKVLHWLDGGAESDNFPGINKAVRLNMREYINPEQHSVCLAGAIRIAAKGRFPKSEKHCEDLDRHFKIKDSYDGGANQTISSLFYDGCGIKDPKVIARGLHWFLHYGECNWD